MDVSQEHFAFFSADGYGGPGFDETGLGEEMTAGAADAGLDGEPMTDLEVRMAKMENALSDIAQELRRQGPLKASIKRRASPKPTLKPKQTTQASSSGDFLPTDTKAMFPKLDAGVVAAALQAGVPLAHLESMQGLMAQLTKATKLKDLNPNVAPDPLSENDGLPDEEEELLPAEYGLGEKSPIASTLSKLTSIVEYLTDEKKKKTSVSKLESALEGGSTGSSDVPLYGSGKKAAQARRAFRSSFEESPGDIAALIEKLMYEDLTSTSLAHGMPPRGLNARAWVEHRSHIIAHKTGAHAAWSVAGILDSLILGNYTKARARCAVLLLMLDQASRDRGNWTLAAELAPEPGPPMNALSNHVGPAVQDGESPSSRLLDLRWAEAALAHLKDQDDYLAKRRNVGKVATTIQKQMQRGDQGPRRRQRTSQRA